MKPRQPDRVELAPSLEISRVVTGLWQVADMERNGRVLDPDLAAEHMLAYARAGFDSFDMADHYGSAEIITGRLLARADTATRPVAFTKWCPAPEAMTRAVVRAGVEERRERLGVQSIDLLQFHWWTFEHLAYIDAFKELTALRNEGVIRYIGVTNVDTDHLRLLVKHGFPIISNQVSFSLLDRRAAEDMSAFCLQSGVRLLAYGTLQGGFLTDRWVGAPEPTTIPDWSKSKYKRFIDEAGGWDALQGILAACREIATKHGVSVANVASRWVLEQPAVATIIVGARLGESEHRDDNLALFSFALDAEDHARIDAALARTKRIPGDCGDEYRRPPFLTASGDLSHHLSGIPKYFEASPVPGRPGRQRVDTGSVWEGICGYSRAVRTGNRILVSGTTATHGSGEVICPGDPAGQTVYILDKIAASLSALGGSLDDVVRTRVYLQNADHWELVSRVHGRRFGEARPANTLLEISRLIGDYLVEIETEALVE
ncbi:aldo/keto reductase [Microvirga massiliensis]|uniref:aldo/keto reductase n=1 Tax=Microvirga massiliensis TaxID=1033741 RepID=UPI00062BAE74|nr:aldo/keto reductase [Microvirga massiliensis]